MAVICRGIRPTSALGGHVRVRRSSAERLTRRRRRGPFGSGWRGPRCRSDLEVRMKRLLCVLLGHRWTRRRVEGAWQGAGTAGCPRLAPQPTDVAGAPLPSWRHRTGPTLAHSSDPCPGRFASSWHPCCDPWTTRDLGPIPAGRGRRDLPADRCDARGAVGMTASALVVARAIAVPLGPGVQTESAADVLNVGLLGPGYRSRPPVWRWSTPKLSVSTRRVRSGAPRAMPARRGVRFPKP